MAKLTQKERRIRKKNNGLSTTSEKPTDDVPTQVECAICMEGINPNKSITLDCGHTFHKTCLNDWNIAQLDGKHVSIITPLNSISKPNEPVIMTVNLNSAGITRCACCRTEYTILGGVDSRGNIVPKKILGKIQFAEIDGEIPVQYITDPRDLLWYVPKTYTSKIKFEMWRPVLMSLMAGVADGTCTEIDAMYCNCGNKQCSGIMLFNKELWEIVKGCEDPALMTPMNVFKIKDCVADPKIVRKLFTNKFS